MPAVLWRLAQQMRLQGEDVIQDAIHAPALEAMVGDHPRTLEVAAQQYADRSVDARLTLHLGFFEQLETPIQRELP